MGLFDWAGDAWDGITDAADWVGDRASDAWGFVADHWQTIAAVAIGTVVFVGVATFAPALLPGLFALAPTLAPWLVLGAAGAASGAATRVFDDLMEGRTPGWDVLKAALITGAVTVVTAGTLQWLAPKVSEAIPALKPLTDHFRVSGGAAGEGAGAAPPVITTPGVKVPAPSVAASSGAASTETAASSTFQVLSPAEAAFRAPKTRGLIGLLSGDAGTHTNNRLDRKADDPPSR